MVVVVLRLLVITQMGPTASDEDVNAVDDGSEIRITS